MCRLRLPAHARQWQSSGGVARNDRRIHHQIVRRLIAALSSGYLSEVRQIGPC